MTLKRALLLLCAIAIPTIAASRGDQNAEYQVCLQDCNALCASDDYPKISRINRIMLWTCIDECKYDCMWKHDTNNRSNNPKFHVLQYHGKWPFIRILGMQEFFSVVFSIGNLLAQLKGFQRLRSALFEVLPRHYALAPLLTAMFVANCNAWIWSAAFHARDFVFTERLDYFSATLLVMTTLFFSIIRIGNIDRRFWSILAVPLVLCYAIHVYYLHFVRFDYSYNMVITAGLGLVFNMLWIINWSCHYNAQTKAIHFKKAALVGLLFTAAGLFEVFDFPPVFHLIDSHSLWHLSTIPIAAFWYDFLVDDIRFCAEQRNAKGLRRRN